MFVASIYRTLLVIFEWIQRNYFSKPSSKSSASSPDREHIEVANYSILDIPAEILLYHVFMRCDAKTLCEGEYCDNLMH